MTNLDALRGLSLDDLVGGADDALVNAIYDASKALNDTRAALRQANAQLLEAQTQALARLYGGEGGAGRNEKERSLNESRTLGADRAVVTAKKAVADAQDAVETAELEVERSRKQFEAVKVRAQVVSALLLAGVENVTPRAQQWQSGNGTIPVDPSEMPF